MKMQTSRQTDRLLGEGVWAGGQRDQPEKPEGVCILNSHSKSKVPQDPSSSDTVIKETGDKNTTDVN